MISQIPNLNIITPVGVPTVIYIQNKRTDREGLAKSSLNPRDAVNKYFPIVVTYPIPSLLCRWFCSPFHEAIIS